MKPHTKTRIAGAMAAVFALLTSVGTAQAQEPKRLLQSDSIPLDLAQALVSAGGFGGAPQILVGAMPG